VGAFECDAVPLQERDESIFKADLSMVLFLALDVSDCASDIG
jgi:hypothetical protein